MATWNKTQYVGVRYKEHKTRRHNGKSDRYFSIRYYHLGKSIEEGAGWSSEGVNAMKANIIRNELVNNNRLGIRPMTLAEKREMDGEKRISEDIERQAQAAENVTFDELAQQYMDWSKTSKKDYQHDISRYEKHIKPVIGHLPAKMISPIHLDKIRITMAKTHSPKTVHHVQALVKSIFYRSITWQVFHGENPVKSISTPKYDNGRIRFLSQTEAALLLDTLRKKNKTVHDKTLLGLFCGMRYSEIARLTWENVNMEEKIISVLDTKTSKNRHIYFGENVHNMFMERMEQSPKRLIFPSTKGAVLLQVEDIFQAVVDDLFNVEVSDRRQRVVFHTTRHTFCSWLVMSGTDLNTVMAMSGHRTLSCVMRYSHLSPDHQRNAVAKLSENYNSATTNNVILISDRKKVVNS